MLDGFIWKIAKGYTVLGTTYSVWWLHIENRVLSIQVCWAKV